MVMTHLQLNGVDGQTDSKLHACSSSSLPIVYINRHMLFSPYHYDVS